MKKLAAFILACLMFSSAAYAQDLNIQVIGGPGMNAQTQSLDDMKIGTSYTLDGYANVTPVEIMTVDCFAQFNKDADYSNVYSRSYDNNLSTVYIRKNDDDMYYNWRWQDAVWQDSGTNAEFVWVKMDVTNLQKKAIDFTELTSVKIIYQDEYEFAGWVRQINYDYLRHDNLDVYRNAADRSHPNAVVLNPENIEKVDMMYTGTYAFGATLPNSVVENAKDSLKMIITMGGNELTIDLHQGN